MSTGDPSGPAPREQITLLLQDWSKGNKQAGDLVMAIIYAELHKLAESRLRRAHCAGTLQPTVIVHEAYQILRRHAERAARAKSERKRDRPLGTDARIQGSER